MKMVSGRTLSTKSKSIELVCTANTPFIIFVFMKGKIHSIAKPVKKASEVQISLFRKRTQKSWSIYEVYWGIYWNCEKFRSLPSLAWRINLRYSQTSIFQLQGTSISHLMAVHSTIRSQSLLCFHHQKTHLHRWPDLLKQEKITSHETQLSKVRASRQYSEASLKRWKGLWSIQGELQERFCWSIWSQGR